MMVMVQELILLLNVAKIYSKFLFRFINCSRIMNISLKYITFKYKAKLLEITVADKANGILSNAKISHPLKYVTNI